MMDYLLNYGVAGAMIIYFITDKIYFQRGIQELVNNNTIAMTKVYEVVSKCHNSSKYYS
jgi:hypothetical protein